MRAALAALAALLAMPVSAAAAPFGEPALHPVGDTSGCMRSTGAPGELARSVGQRVQFLQATTAGLTIGRSLPVQNARESCPRVAARPGGAGVLGFVAGDEGAPEPTRVRVHLRDPGGDWGSAVDAFPLERDSFATQPAVAVSERGDALVATTVMAATEVRLIVARRVPGAGFGAPQALARAAATELPSVIFVRVGMSATGEAVVVWGIRPTGRPGDTTQLWAAFASPGEAFGAPQRIGTVAAGVLQLTVAPDGRALAVFATADGFQVAERAPGAAFGAPQRLGGEALTGTVTAALRPDGGAIVAWTGLYGGPVVAAVRERPGAFAAPVRVSGQPSLFDFYDPLIEGTLRFYLSDLFGATVADIFEATGVGIQAAITGDGRALLTWGTLEADPDDVGAVARSASVPLIGGAVETRSHGPGLRGSGSITPVVLAGGVAAAAWTDVDRGRVHLAVEGAADGADPAPPRVRLGRPVRSTLPDAQPLVLPFTCSAACEVRAEIAGSRAIGVASRSRAGRGTIKLPPLLRPIGRLDGGPTRVLVRYGAPGARRAEQRTVTLRLRRRPVPPLRVIGLTARRSGSSVVVRWRTTRPTSSGSMTVIGLATRDDDATPVAVDELGVSYPETEESRFELRLRRARDARWVVVLTDSDGVASRMRRATVRVRE